MTRDVTHLHARLRETQSLTELLPHEGVGVVGLFKQSLQLVQLFQGEVRSTTSLLDLRGFSDRDFFRTGPRTTARVSRCNGHIFYLYIYILFYYFKTKQNIF